MPHAHALGLECESKKANPAESYGKRGSSADGRTRSSPYHADQPCRKSFSVVPYVQYHMDAISVWDSASLCVF
ncbi:hypothetical protein CPC08DRAFT_715193 [Agrocybe pediades]|nr:hypothetical protein CPC08DRAFT_715193 [Agrocybe pediades]